MEVCAWGTEGIWVDDSFWGSSSIASSSSGVLSKRAMNFLEVLDFLEDEDFLLIVAPVFLAAVLEGAPEAAAEEEAERGRFRRGSLSRGAFKGDPAACCCERVRGAILAEGRRRKVRKGGERKDGEAVAAVRV